MTNCGPHTRQGIVMLHAPLPKCTFWHLKYATLWGKTLGDILFAYSNLHWWCFMLKCMHEQEHQNTCYKYYRSFSYQNQLRGWILATHIYENAMRLLYIPISMNGSKIMIHVGFRPDAEVKIFGMNCLFVWHWCAAKPPMAFFREDNNTSPLSICSINL